VRRKEECPKPPAWLTSFSDLMSLLLTFFVLIYSMSSLDVAQLEKFISYFQPERKFLMKKTSILPPINPPPEDVALKIKSRIQKVLPPWAFQIVVAADFVKLKLFDNILFEEGSYRLTPKAVESLRELSDVIKKLPENAFVRIEGHVSGVEEVKDQQVRDRWELSLRRATEVVRYLQSQGVDPKRMAAAGFGDTKPLYTWKQPVLLKRNSRVEIYISLSRAKE